MTRLRRSDPHGPGLSRVRRGRGWEYRMPDGTRITDAALLERLRAMAIPPAWTDVWVSPHENGHVLATGMDDAGRRQYIYHPAWHERMAREKFDRMLQLAAVMPGVRAGVTRDLRQDGFGRPRVLAGAFRMLDSAMLRVGSEQYARQHGSIGLATLRGSHAHVSAERTVELAFPGKSGQAWDSRVEDPDLAALVAGLKRRGPRALLLSWQDGSTWHPIRPADINDDVRARTGGDFTAKDFRTLHGTIVAATELARIGPRDTDSARRRAVAAAMRATAAALGNTPAVARSGYVDPRVLDLYDDGIVVDTGRRVEPQLGELLA
ncbi:DNA topoisomerase IB [Microbacterium arabinogalactanolyticum]|uniref:DNA topoisomerase IB n=1 Tax=Microbacterium arabinogalactanolyticum TaxID=69365 RepID=UPI002555DF4E|nr:DNA topoisomerase IB [Microbacterium arabinogalactanolyticum]GLC86853.1 DNA topoisomerase [Microbacterium arabinogalactanolyticum]